MQRVLIVILILCLCLAVFVGLSSTTVSAQTRVTPTPTLEPDRDGDGVPDGSDGCPSEPGPASNRGCPLPDSDGDGVPDVDDQCSGEPGPASNNGCPAPPPPPDQPPPVEQPQQPAEEATPTPTPQIVLPDLPTDGPCVLATRQTDWVFLRRRPSTSDPDNIVGRLGPVGPFQQAYLKITMQDVLISSYQTGGSAAEGHGDEIEVLSWSWGETSAEIEETWFMVNHQGEPAWVFAGAVRQGGDCNMLPAVQVSGNNLKQIGLALHPFHYTWTALEGSPMQNFILFQEDGTPVLDCDALQELMACDGSVHTLGDIADGTSNTILVGENFDPLTLGDGVVDARDFAVWRDNLGGFDPSPDDTASTSLAILPDAEQAALLLPAIQKVRAPANTQADSFFDIYFDLSVDSAGPGVQEAGIIIVGGAPNPDTVPMETFSLNFAPIKFEDDEDGLGIIIINGLPGGNAEPQANNEIVFDDTQGSQPIIIGGLMNDEGDLEDVLVQFMTAPGPPSAPAGQGDITIKGKKILFIGSHPDPSVKGLVVLIVAQDDLGSWSKVAALEIGW